ncbi:hypothetical protein SDC9_09057 [bioreactor metagenome]|uniref:DRTGG domain-containing protein n=1 Tax=bioreactor metagenome TaxID=1076179 RepID=A0A644T9B7_9ZZZZ|nr:hypothetical protein [Negativicutes bacterium]
MKLEEVGRILEADLLCGEDLLLREVVTVCGSDLLSDVLAFTIQETLLLTALINMQVIRTADLSDLIGIVFVNGKRPGTDLIAMAQQKRIPLFVTRLPMYEACGRLYQYGLKGCI